MPSKRNAVPLQEKAKKAKKLKLRKLSEKKNKADGHHTHTSLENELTHSHTNCFSHTVN
jgi:hypothetical protein